jgi:hypothetical protein
LEKEVSKMKRTAYWLLTVLIVLAIFALLISAWECHDMSEKLSDWLQYVASEHKAKASHYQAYRELRKGR